MCRAATGRRDLPLCRQRGAARHREWGHVRWAARWALSQGRDPLQGRPLHHPHSATTPPTALTEVQSFGTEDRPPDHPTPTREEYTTVCGSDSQDIAACELPKPVFSASGPSCHPAFTGLICFPIQSVAPCGPRGGMLRGSLLSPGLSGGRRCGAVWNRNLTERYPIPKESGVLPLPRMQGL